MKSMTGYGSAEGQDERMRVAVEVRSYNHRFLDVSVSLPAFLNTLEPAVRQQVAKRAVRGRVEVGVRVTEFEEDLEVVVDWRVAAAYKQALEELSTQLGLQEKVGLSHLLRLEGVIKTDRTRNPERYWVAVEPLLARALDAWDEARAREGDALARDLEQALVAVEAERVQIAGRREHIERAIREDLRRRFAEVLAGEVDEARVYAETAVMLVRFDVNEELVRLAAHIAAFREAMDGGQASGKRLDFIAQELHREITTIGSKSLDSEVSAAVIRAKDAIERIREQVRNVE